MSFITTIFAVITQVISIFLAIDAIQLNDKKTMRVAIIMLVASIIAIEIIRS